MSFLISLVPIVFGKSSLTDCSSWFSSGFKAYKASFGFEAFIASTVAWSSSFFPCFSESFTKGE